MWNIIASFYNYVFFILNLYFLLPLHKRSIGIEKKSPSEIFSEFHVSGYVDSEK